MNPLDHRTAAETATPPAPARHATRLPVIDSARCTGCGWCVSACAPRVLSLEVVQWKKVSVLHDPAGCTGCSLCFVRCPFDAITMRRPGAGEAHVE